MDKVTYLESPQIFSDFVLIESNNKKVLKPVARFIAEQKLNRKLAANEFPIIGPGDSPTIKQVNLFFSQNEFEVREVKGYEDKFLVSENGLLISKRTNKVLTQNVNPKGYLNHATKIGGRSGANKYFKIHRVVAEAFIDNEDNKPEVNHINADKTDNTKRNLEWVTSKENTRHAIESGLITTISGSGHPSCVFSHKEVLEIKHKIETSGRSLRSIAKDHDVDKNTIRDIKLGITYSDI
jgi:hypothetical protein